MVGFVAVAIFAALLLMSYAQLTVASAEVVSLRSQLSDLKEENATLTAQYEKVFDIDTIQAAVGETMIRPTSDQVTYVDLSEPDTVVVYGEEAQGGPLGALKSLGQMIGEILEYFR